MKDLRRETQSFKFKWENPTTLRFEIAGTLFFPFGILNKVTKMSDKATLKLAKQTLCRLKQGERTGKKWIHGFYHCLNWYSALGLVSLMGRHRYKKSLLTL
jgi:hypothetical protein